MRLFILLAWLVIIPTIGRAADAPKLDPKAKLNYDTHILPILRDKCLGCHNQDKAKGGLDLSTYSGTMEGGSSGPVVKSGDSDGSRLWTLTAHKEEPAMPPKSPIIAKESIDLIATWIRQGALENSGSKAVAVKPKIDVSLKSVVRGKPEGPPPMPGAAIPKVPVVATTPKANAVVALAVNPWSPLVAIGGQKQVLLYNGDNGQMIGILPFKHGMPHVLKFSRNGSLLLVGGGIGGKSGKVVVFDIRSGEIIIEVGNENDAVLAADISADQQQIALAGPGKMIRIYSTKDGSLLREMKKHTDWVYTLEFSPDAVLLATADRSGGLVVWEAATGREFYNLRGHTAAITDVAWRDDSNWLASASEDGSIRLWEMENGNQVKTWPAHAGGVQSVRFAHDNRIASTGRDKFVRLWDANGNAKGGHGPIDDVGLRVGFTSDNTRVIVGDWTGTVKALNVENGKIMALMSSNVPDALADAKRLYIEKEAAVAAASATQAAAVANQAKIQAEAAPFQKAIADAMNAANTLNAALAVAKANADKMTAMMAAYQPKLQALEIKSAVLTEAANKLKAAADANKANTELQTFAAQSKQAADVSNAELAVVKKAVIDLTPQLAQATAAFTTAQQNVTNITNTLNAANAAAAPKLAALKAAMDAVNAANAAVAKISAEVNAARAEVEKLSPKK